MDSLLSKFISKSTSINEIFPLITANNAYIAGGALVSTFLDSEIKDYDIYINIDNAFMFIYKLIELKYIVGAKIFSKNTTYTKSFFVKNGILSRISLKKNNIVLDVIITRIPPLICISRFDLTCCQVWFDGNKINGTHMDLFFKKISYSNPEYDAVNSAILRKRKTKYFNKGFKIIPMPETDFYFNSFLPNEYNKLTEKEEISISIIRSYVFEHGKPDPDPKQSILSYLKSFIW